MPTTATPATPAPSLEEVAAAIVRATRLRNVEVKLTPSGREARIVLDKRTLAFVHTKRSGDLRVHVMHYGREERFTVPTPRAAAPLVKASERRLPKKATA